MTIKKLYELSELGKLQLLIKKNGEPYAPDYIPKLVQQKRLKTTLVASGFLHLVEQEEVDRFNKENKKSPGLKIKTK